MMNQHNTDTPPDYAPAGDSSQIHTPEGAGYSAPEERLPTAAAEFSLPDAPIMAADGTFAPDWYKRFDELEPYGATLAKFRRPEALAKSYAHLERLKGYPDTADSRRMAAFRAAVGLPDSAEQFSLSRPEDTPDELWNPALVQSMAQVAYEYGVPPKAMEAMCKRYAAEGRRFMQEMQQQQEEEIRKADAQLQELWGTHYEDNLRTVSAFLHTMGERAGVDSEQLMQHPALRANPEFARLMLEAATLMQEAPLRTGAAADGKQEAYRIAHDPAHPLHEAYMRTNHPRHSFANEQYDRLAFGHRL
ncbi:MAG: hypothetical protein IJB00_03620 [Akkermansia sp.]|nr:hypothetical protein [Akkermansia sp.]